MEYSLYFTEEGKRLLHTLHIENQRKIKRSLKELLRNPTCGKPLSGSLTGFFSYKIGNYRAIYSQNKEKIVIHYVGHRKGIYQKAEGK